MRAAYDHIVATVTPDKATFENVLLPWAHAENTLLAEGRLLCIYRDVSPDATLREAANTAHAQLAEFRLQIRSRQDLFDLVDAVYNSEESNKLDPESQHLLNCVHRKYAIEHGLKLPAGQPRDRFTTIQLQIQELGSTFSHNLTERSVRGEWYSAEELDGVPADELASMEERSDDGKLLASFRKHYGIVMRHANDSSVRRRMWAAFQNKCNENSILFREVTLLRDEAARLLGYRHHAELALEEKMAGNTKTVDSLLQELLKRLLPRGRQEVDTIKKVKAASLETAGLPFDGHLFQWDLPFYRRQLVAEEGVGVNADEVSEYFNVETVLPGIIAIFEHLFVIDFKELPPDLPGDLWHTDVQRFGVWSGEASGGGFLGYIYMDLFSRDFKMQNSSNATWISLVPVCAHESKRAFGYRVIVGPLMRFRGSPAQTEVETTPVARSFTT